MPCITGRSSHVLCDPGCADANKCCRQTTAFSVNRFCFCEESKKNPNNQLVSVADVRLMICDAITSGDVLTGTTPAALASDICDLELPVFECPVTVNIQMGSGPVVPIATVFRGQCQDPNTSTDALAAGEWTLLIDTFICTTFTVASP